jgi:hypothetical protein
VLIISEVPPDPNYTRGVMSFYREDIWLDSLRPIDITRAYLGNLDRGVDYAFFVELGQDSVLELLNTYYYLLPPQNSPYPELETYQQFPLYYAPYLPGYSNQRWERLDKARPAYHHQPARW